MKLKKLFLPGLALGGAALLVAPETSFGTFSVSGASLSLSQRDFRVRNGFLDSQANDNTTPHYNFPGQLGADMALWKGVSEWQSDPHGDGAGDPLQSTIGDANANFDPAFMGNVNGIGGTNDNILSDKQTACCPGVLGFTELPTSDGWRIRFCDDEWIWNDGPAGVPASHFDLQSVACHEYGHALGLGHSCDGAATMFFALSAGDESTRSTSPDDRAGVQAVYLVKTGTKPEITYLEPDTGAGTMTIVGLNFSPTGNDVWFTPSAVTGTATDPRVIVSDVVSTGSGTQIVVTIPAAAGSGQVLVQKDGTGNAALSNAFPTNLVDPTGTPPPSSLSLDTITPSTVEALIPGTSETVTLGGVGFLDVTSLELDSVTIDPLRYTIVNDTTITLDMPQADQLGAAEIKVVTASDDDAMNVDVVVPASAKLELGDGDAMNPVTTTLDVIVSGEVGDKHIVLLSLSGLPSSSLAVDLDMGNGFSDLRLLRSYTIGNKGWSSESFDLMTQLSLPTGTAWGQTIVEERQPLGPLELRKPFVTGVSDVSNLQSVDVQ